MQHINWDNLRYVLMVANQESISAAARELGVNRTTVLRRINRFQQDLNCRIFDRGDAGYVLTPEAEKMINAAREVENTLFNMQRQIAGRESPAAEQAHADVRARRAEGFLAMHCREDGLAGVRIGPYAREPAGAVRARKPPRTGPRHRPGTLPRPPTRT